MKHDQFIQIFFLSSFLSILFSSGDVFAYKESDFYKLKNTKKCIECDLTDLNLSRLILRSVNSRWIEEINDNIICLSLGNKL